MKAFTFDTMEEGFIAEFGRYEVTAEEIIRFAEEFDPHPFHLDEAQARKSPFKGLVASGWHTCSLTMRMLVDNYFEGSSSIGSPGVDEIRWLKPVRPGDILSVRIETIRKKLSTSKPDRGTVWHKVSVFNHKDEKVMAMVAMTMFLRTAP